MNISNLITQIITEMLEGNEYADIQRNELAGSLGCVPSQINYVIASRFTPEHGYLVESRRGGGGYIRIYRRIPIENDELMETIGRVGDRIEDIVCRTHIVNLLAREAITENEARLLASATCDNCYRDLPLQYREILRAAVFKQLLLTLKNLKAQQKEE